MMLYKTAPFLHLFDRVSLIIRTNEGTCRIGSNPGPSSCQTSDCDLPVQKAPLSGQDTTPRENHQKKQFFIPVIEYFPGLFIMWAKVEDRLTDHRIVVKMRALVEVDLHLERVHCISKFYRVPVMFRQVFFQEDKNE